MSYPLLRSELSKAKDPYPNKPIRRRAEKSEDRRARGPATTYAELVKLGLEMDPASREALARDTLCGLRLLLSKGWR